MSDKLISCSWLINRLKENKNLCSGGRAYGKTFCSAVYDMAREMVMDLIKEAPEMYDLDAVKKEIKDRSFLVTTSHDVGNEVIFGEIPVVGLDDVLDAVKNGGKKE